MEQLEVSFAAQKQSTSQAFESLSVAEKKLFEKDRDLNMLVDDLEDADLALATQTELDRERAERLVKLEKQRAKRWEGEQVAAIEARAAQLKELKLVADKQVEATRRLHATAVKKVVESTAKTKDVASKIKASRDATLQDKTDAVLELKANQSAARAKVASQAARHNKKIEDARVTLENEKDSLLAKGVNPYAFFRKRDLDSQADAQEKAMLDAVRNNESALAASLIKEQEDRRVEDLAVRKAKAYEKKHRDEQGRHVIEERNNEYITKITTGNMEVLDPTGRAPRIDPSQITDIHDHSFGLGKSNRIPADSMKRITEQIRQELNVEKDDIGEYQRLVEGLLPPDARGKKKDTVPLQSKKGGLLKPSRSQSAGSGTRPRSGDTAGLDEGEAGVVEEQEEDPEKVAARVAEAERDRKIEEAEKLSRLAHPWAPIAGINAGAIKRNFGDSIEEHEQILRNTEIAYGDAVDEEKMKREAAEAEGKVKYKIPDPSAFEKTAFERAKGRQRSRVEEGVTQVAGGRTFKGQAFIPQPAEVVFADFEVGKSYKNKFTLTNTSYTFNSFKILALPDEFVDFFVITFAKPGRMSAGVSCSIEVAFTPEFNKDIHTSISFFTETGPVSVPLVCLVRKCAPRVIDSDLNFGNVVIGQIVKQQVRIKNSQALGTTFVVKSIESATIDSHLDAENLLPAEEVTVEAAEASRPATSTASAATSRRPSVLPPPLHSASDGKSPAINDAELEARIQRALTKALQRKLAENPAPLSVKVAEGSVDGYGTSAVEVTCAPLSLGSSRQSFLVTFAGVEDAQETRDEQGVLVTKEQVIHVTVTAEDVPIYVADIDVDALTTLHGRIYRKRLELRNRGLTSSRVTISIPSPFGKYIEVSPDMCFVQGGASQWINIKFAPTAELLQHAAHFSVLQEGYKQAAKIGIPIEITAANQELPVFFVMKSVVTTSALEFNVKSLDFGKVFVNQQSSLQLSITNTSMLPQKLAFVRLRKELTVQPNDGFAVLLPNETCVFDVLFSPPSAVNYDLPLTVLTSFNDTYTIKTIAEGVEPPFEFSHMVVNMRSTAPGQRVIENITVTNKGPKQQCFEIVLPDPRFSWLRIAPAVVDLAPGCRARIEIEFSPPRDVAQWHPTQWHEGLVEAFAGDGGALESKADRPALPDSPFEEWSEDEVWAYARGLFGDLQWTKPMVAPAQPATEGADAECTADTAAEGAEAAIPDQEWGIVGRWRLPICIRQRSKGVAAVSPTRGGSAAGLPFPLFLAVQTVVTPPQIEADVSALDFGQLSVGSRVIKHFVLTNHTFDDILLGSGGLNAVGPFTLLTPPKTIRAKSQKRLALECLLAQSGLQVEVLELLTLDGSGGHRVRIPLRVEGVSPMLELRGLQPMGTSRRGSGILDFGHVVATDSVTMDFEVVNKSHFPVVVNLVKALLDGLPLKRRKHVDELNTASQPVFSFSPEDVSLQPGEGASVAVLFIPDMEMYRPYRDDVNVSVGKTSEVLRASLFGRSWRRQVYLVPADPRDEPFQRSTEDYFEDDETDNPVKEVRDAAKKRLKDIHLELPGRPSICLEFPNPYADGIDPSSYKQVDANPNPKEKGALPTLGGRQQTKSFAVGCAKIHDAKREWPKAGPGTFELRMSQEAVDSKLFNISVDKGAVAVGTEVRIDVTCTLPEIRTFADMKIGGWREFKCAVVVKGGWVREGDPDEETVWVKFKCFVGI